MRTYDFELLDERGERGLQAGVPRLDDRTDRGADEALAYPARIAVEESNPSSIVQANKTLPLRGSVLSETRKRSTFNSNGPTMKAIPCI